MMIDETIKSKTLAIRVILYRVFGIDKDLAIECMKELSLRKEKGDLFDYENFIAEEIKKIPKSKNMNLTSVINNIRKVSKSV